MGLDIFKNMSGNLGLKGCGQPYVPCGQLGLAPILEDGNQEMLKKIRKSGNQEMLKKNRKKIRKC